MAATLARERESLQSPGLASPSKEAGGGREEEEEEFEEVEEEVEVGGARVPISAVLADSAAYIPRMSEAEREAYIEASRRIIEGI